MIEPVRQNPDRELVDGDIADDALPRQRLKTAEINMTTIKLLQPVQFV